jgi:hypothetical protein
MNYNRETPKLDLVNSELATALAYHRLSIIGSNGSCAFSLSLTEFLGACNILNIRLVELGKYGLAVLPAWGRRELRFRSS